jgi:hypothetical protein
MGQTKRHIYLLLLRIFHNKKMMKDFCKPKEEYPYGMIIAWMENTVLITLWDGWTYRAERTKDMTDEVVVNYFNKNIIEESKSKAETLLPHFYFF